MNKKSIAKLLSLSMLLNIPFSICYADDPQPSSNSGAPQKLYGIQYLKPEEIDLLENFFNEISLGSLQNLNARSELFNNTPLIEATFRGNLAVVKALIKAGANLDLQNLDQNTALIIAALQGNYAIIKALIDAEANLNLYDWNNWTALMTVAATGNYAIAKVLIGAGARLDLKNDNLETALHIAQKLNNLQIVDLILEKQAKIVAE